METLSVKPEQLLALSKAVFAAQGLADDHATTVAEGLVKANLRGVDSHGVARIPMYLHRLREGVINKTPQLKARSVTPAVSLVDGDNGMGFVVGRYAMNEAIRLAADIGIGLVGVRNSGHFGMSAVYVLQALEAGLISFVYTNSSPAMPVWGGRSKFLGASPFAAGAPGGESEYLLDMACTITARGKLKYAAQRGEAIPEGLALDSEGKPTTDGEAAFHGTVLPFGEAKGAALAMLMDILCGVLTGAAFAGDVKNPYTDTSGPQNVGHFFVALKPDLFVSQHEYESRMDTLIRRAKSGPLANGFDEILIPGEPETRAQKERLKNGIPLSADVVEHLRAELEACSLNWDDFLSS